MLQRKTIFAWFAGIAIGLVAASVAGLSSLPASVPLFSVPEAFAADYGFYRTITIDHTKVPNATQSDFPVLVSGTHSFLRTVANGGRVENANGFDVAFFSDSALTTQLKHETEKYVASTGEVVYWVKVPSLSHTTDTVIYMAYGDASISTDQSDRANVWDASFKGVWHLPNGTTLTAVNSVTGTSDDIGTVTATTGQVDGGALFEDTETDNVTTGLGSTSTLATYSIWSYRSGEGGGGLGRMFQKSPAGATVRLINDTGSNYGINVSWSTLGSWSFAEPTANAWHHVAFSYDGSSAANDPVVYVDGNPVALTVDTNPTGTRGFDAQPYVIGGSASNANREWLGSLDEFRVSHSIRSADWIKAEYNNQSSPSTFYAVGNETSTSGDPTVTVSGTLRQGNGSSALDCSTGGARTVLVKVNGSGSYSGDCTLSNGSYSVSGVEVSPGDVVTVFLDGETEKGAVVTRALDASTSITADLYQNHLIVRHEDGGPLTNANLDQYDDASGGGAGDGDIPFGVAAGNLTLADNTKLLVWTGKTFAPGGAVSASPSADGTDAVIDGDVAVQSSATLAMAANALSVGGDFANAGTFTKSGGQTTTFTATAAGHAVDMGTGNFGNVVLNGSGGGWSFSDASSALDGDLTVTAGTLSGTTDLTVSGDVTGSGTIDLADGTFTHSTTGSKAFGGSAAWGFNDLTFSGASGTSAAAGAGSVTASGTLTIAANHTLNAGSKTWILPGDSAPLVAAGTLAPGSSTFRFSGGGAGGSVADGTVTIYQANVQHATHTDGSFDPAGQADVLAASGVDIVTANEVGGSDLSGWDTRFAALGFTRALYVDNASGNNDGQAIWYRNATVTLHATSTHALSSGFVGWSGIDVDRTAAAAEVTVNGERFHVVAVHLCHSACADSSGSTFSAQRVSQATELIDWIGSTLTGRDVIIAGDLNFGPNYPKSPSGLQLDTFTADYSDLWQQGIAEGKATAPWGDRNADGIADMPVTNLTTRTHDTRRIDYVLLNDDATSLELESITVPDLRETCPHALVAGGALPSCSPEVQGGPGVSGQQWDIEDDFGVRPSDHNFIKTVFNTLTDGGDGTLAVPALSYSSLELDNASTTYVAAAGTLTVNGALEVAGTLDLDTNDPTVTVAGATTIDGTLEASATASLTLNGNLVNNGTFAHNGGSVTLAPSGALIEVKGTSGTAFHDFALDGPGKTLRFKDGNTYAFAGTLTLSGSSGQLLEVQSTADGVQWLMTLSGTAVASDLLVTDSGCSGGTTVSGTNLVDGGNNGSCWTLVAASSGGGGGGGGGGGSSSGGGSRSNSDDDSVAEAPSASAHVTEQLDSIRTDFVAILPLFQSNPQDPFVLLRLRLLVLRLQLLALQLGIAP